MTTEQAIKLLHRLQDEQFDGEYGDERREALDMAVRALEGDGDTIYRKAAIDVIKSYWKNEADRISKKSTDFDVFTQICDLILSHNANICKAIDKLPPAQPHWIPCSERLPDEFGEYLVTKKAIGWNCEEYNSNDIAYFDNEGFHKADKVLAWMPLPEPYGGESDES